MLDSDHDSVPMQFDRLIEEVLSGSLNRSRFRPWEIGILVDMVSCELPGASRCVTMLRQYQAAIQQRMREGAQVPMKLSEYLELQGKSSPLAARRPRASRCVTLLREYQNAVQRRIREG